MPVAPYIKKYGDHNIYYVPLKPTGKWKLKSGPYDDNDMYIQHQGFIFTQWIHEDSIYFKPAIEEEIFTCH